LDNLTQHNPRHRNFPNATGSSSTPDPDHALDQCRRHHHHDLLEQEMIIKLICVAGWDYISHWSGVNRRAFFERIGAYTTAKYVAFRCADDYIESLDT
jgi:hypothetical protein